MRGYFGIDRETTTVTTELMAGITTFLSVSYILAVNPAILKVAGMPVEAVFVATGLAAGVSTIILALFARTPFAIAPGMGVNSLVAYTLCVAMGFYWREALAVTFVSGVLNVLLFVSPLRKTLVKSIPGYLKYANSVGIGLFISYVGIKNTGIIMYTNQPDTYIVTAGGVVIGNSFSIPSLVDSLSYSHLVAAFGLVVTLYLLGLEKKTGERYTAFLIGIIAATFIGIPLSVTDLTEAEIFDLSIIFEARQVLFSCFGDPGLLSLFSLPGRFILAVTMCLVLFLTTALDSVTTIVGSGRTYHNPIFDEKDMADFYQKKGMGSKLDKTLVANSAASVVSAVVGISPCTVYVESVIGMAAGGRTGLTALVIGILFLACLPFIGFVQIIPLEAVAPALIISGIYLLVLVMKISWQNLDEAIPAGLTILVIPATYNVLNSIAVGLVSHMVMQFATGKWRSMHPFIYVIVAALACVFVLNAV